MSIEVSFTEDLTNPEYTLASELWYQSEQQLKQCVEAGDVSGSLKALEELKYAVARRFEQLLTREELEGAFIGILGGILHFACRDAGLPPAYLTMMILWQKETFASAEARKSTSPSIESCVIYACKLVNRFSIPSYSPLVRRCMLWIGQNLTASFHMNTLAASLNISRPYLSTCFHKETGQTLTEYINRERVTLAKYYLQQTHFSITQIAFMCGYTDLNYFGRTFKKIEDISPGQYRKAHRI